MKKYLAYLLFAALPFNVGAFTYGTTGSGGGDVTTAQLTTALTGKADQVALDALSTISATKAELAAIQTQVDNKPDGVVISNAARQVDQSILLTYSDATTATIAASPQVDISGKAEQTDLVAEAARAAAAEGVNAAAITAINTAQTAQDTAIGLKADATALHDPITLNAGSDTALALVDQELNLTLPPAATIDTAITDGSANAVENNAIFDDQALQNVVIASKADQTALDAEIARATAAEGVNAAAIADEATRADAAELVNAAAIAAETTRAQAAEALLLPKADKATLGELQAGTAGDKYADPPVLKAYIDSVVAGLAGDHAGSAATYAALPTTKNGANPIVSLDWAFLNTDDIGTGTAQAPQFEAGIWVYDGAQYNLAHKFPDGLETYYRGDYETVADANATVATPKLGDYVTVTPAGGGGFTFRAAAVEGDFIAFNAELYAFATEPDLQAFVPPTGNGSQGFVFGNLTQTWFFGGGVWNLGALFQDPLQITDGVDPDVSDFSQDGNFVVYQDAGGGGGGGPSEFAHWNGTEFELHASDEITEVQVTSTTGADYSTFGLITAERLDQWGSSRKLQRVFNCPDDPQCGAGVFDFTALGYGDNEAIYVRNGDSSNGINIIYGAGGANRRLLTKADSTFEDITGQDAFNLQPGEVVIVEQTGTDVRGSIMPAERISKQENYASAAANGPYPHDGIVLIQDAGEIFGRKTNTNAAVFPADGQANADWWKVGGDFVGYGTTTEKNALGVVTSNTPFFDTILGKLQRYDTSTGSFQVIFGTAHQPYVINWPSNATSGSGINFKVTEDPDATVGVSSISLPDGTQKQIWIVAQQVNGNVPAVGGAGTIGGTAIIRNDGGVVSLASIPNESRWNNVGSWTTLSYNQLPNLVADAIDVTDTETQRILVNVPGAGIWVDIEADTDQASAWSPSTAYFVGDIRSAVEPDTGDSESGRTFNWFRTTAGTSGATFDVAESGDWQRMTLQQNPEDWVTVDGDGAGPLYLAAYSTKVRLIGATQTLQLPTPGGVNVDRDTVIRNDSPNTWTVLHSGTDTYISGNTAAEAAPAITLESGRTIRIVSGQPDTNSITYNEVGAGGTAGGDLDVMSRSGNNNPGNGNPFQHSEEHLNLGGITYAAGVYTIGTAGNYAINYGIQQVQNSNTGNVSAGLFVNNTQQGSGVGLSNDSTNNWPFGGSSEVSLSLSAGDTVELRQIATPGFGGTNKVTSVSITQIPQSAVVDPTLVPVDDQAATGFMDIGNMRMQWGDAPSATGGTVTFPQAFGNVPVITATSSQNSGHNISVLTKSATQFTFDQWDVNNVQQNGTFNWIAIGLKP